MARPPYRPTSTISRESLLRLWKHIYTLASEVGADHGLLPGELFNAGRKRPTLARARHDLADKLRKTVFFRDVNGCRLVYIAPDYDTTPPHNYQPASHPMLAKMLGLCQSAFAVRRARTLALAKRWQKGG